MYNVICLQVKNRSLQLVCKNKASEEQSIQIKLQWEALVKTVGQTVTAIVQWRNRRGGRVPPRDFWPGNFCRGIGKKEAMKKGKRGKNWEVKEGNCKREGGTSYKKRWGFFFFFFFLLFTFENKNLFWVYQNGNFLPGKNISCWEINEEKWLLPPQKNMPVTPLQLCYVAVLFSWGMQPQSKIAVIDGP